MSRNARIGSFRSVERLESRQLMAGDVAVTVLDGNLLIDGDELANQIAVTAGDTANSYRIVGFNGTTVHQSSSADPPASELLVSGVTGNVAIRMGHGDDVVHIDDAAFHGNVSIATDGGSDQVVLGIPPELVPVPVSATSDTAADPPLPFDGVYVGGSLRIATGAADDTIRIGHATVRGNLMVIAGAGDDKVVIGVPPPDPAALAAAEEPGASVKVGHEIAIHLGTGNDALSLQNAEAHRGILADGGFGNDRMYLSGLNAGSALRVVGGLGDGSDGVELNHVRARTAFVQTGEGNDDVAIVDSTFGMLAVALGDGDDNLAIGGLTAGIAMFYGGEGDDTLTLLADNMIGRRIVRRFENLPPDPAPTA